MKSVCHESVPSRIASLVCSAKERLGGNGKNLEVDRFIVHAWTHARPSGTFSVSQIRPVKEGVGQAVLSRTPVALGSRKW